MKRYRIKRILALDEPTRYQAQVRVCFFFWVDLHPGQVSDVEVCKTRIKEHAERALYYFRNVLEDNGSLYFKYKNEWDE